MSDHTTDVPIPGDFTRPFQTDVCGVGVYDADMRLAADFYGPDGAFRPRGWGRIVSRTRQAGGTYEDAGVVMDAWLTWAMKRAGGARTPQEAVALLNDVTLDTERR